VPAPSPCAPPEAAPSDPESEAFRAESLFSIHLSYLCHLKVTVCTICWHMGGGDASDSYQIRQCRRPVDRPPAGESFSLSVVAGGFKEDRAIACCRTYRRPGVWCDTDA